MIELVRTYGEKETLGRIYFNGVEICQSIELPWLDNMTNKSCIPEGVYNIQHRYTTKFGDHLLIENVPGRSGILFHPANNPKKELRGCIAPVMEIRAGHGMFSKVALQALLRNIHQVGIQFCNLKISSNENNHAAVGGSHPKIFQNAQECGSCHRGCRYCHTHSTDHPAGHIDHDKRILSDSGRRGDSGESTDDAPR